MLLTSAEKEESAGGGGAYNKNEFQLNYRNYFRYNILDETCSDGV